MTVTHKINMDLARRGVTPRIDAVQGDERSRVLEFSLYAEGIEWTPPTSATVVVRYIRPDGKAGNYAALKNGSSAGNIDGNTVSVTLVPLVLAVAGMAQVAIGLISGNEEITTFCVEIKIQKNPGISNATMALGNAEATDVAAGKTFTSSNGAGTGVLEEVSSDSSYTNTGGEVNYMAGSNVISPVFIASKDADSDKIIRSGATVNVWVAAAQMGDAAPEDVAAGKTFTSENGLKLTGTRIGELDVDTSDATATAADIANGVTAYVDGEKVDGAVPVISTYDGRKDIEPVTNAIGGVNYICLNSPKFGANGQMFREGSHFYLAALPGEFGDATADDVAAGKTFTSAAGLVVTGTAEKTSVEITDDGNGNVVINSTSVTNDGSGNIVVT